MRYAAEKMRCILSIVLVMLLTFPLVAPALGESAQQRLFLCCRKGGAHHCLTSAAMEDGGPAPTLRAHCPANPKPAVTAHTADGMIGAAHATFASDKISAMRVRQTEAGYQISFYRSRQKRGPPSLVLS